MQIHDVSSVVPGKSLVKFTVYDKFTGKPLPRFNMDWKPNTSTPMAKEVAVKVLAGVVNPVPYTAAYMEWGQGSTNPVFDNDNPDLEAPFVIPVFTPLEAPVSTGVKGQIKFFSSIDDSHPNVVSGETTIREVGLRTAPLNGYPKGILIARFQNDSPLTISASRIRIGVEWIYIYI